MVTQGNSHHPHPFTLANHHAYAKTTESSAFSFTWVHTLMCYISREDYAFRWPPGVWDILTRIVIDRPLKIIGMKQIFCETASTSYPGLFFPFICYSEILDSKRANLVSQDCLRHASYLLHQQSILVLKIEKAHSQPGWC